MSKSGTGNGKNWPRVGASVFLESAVGTELGSLNRSWHLAFSPRKERKGRAYYIRLATRIPLPQHFTLLSGCTLVPQLFELRGIVEKSPPPPWVGRLGAHEDRVAFQPRFTTDNMRQQPQTMTACTYKLQPCPLRYASSRPSGIHFGEIPPVVFLDKIRALLRHSIRGRHDIATYVAWEHRRVDNTQALYALHLESVVESLAHGHRSNGVVLSRDVSPHIFHSLLLGLDAVLLSWPNSFTEALRQHWSSGDLVHPLDPLGQDLDVDRV
jgi:hypothetical protein